jgi:hypothetical protein
VPFLESCLNLPYVTPVETPRDDFLSRKLSKEHFTYDVQDLDYAVQFWDTLYRA